MKTRWILVLACLLTINPADVISDVWLAARSFAKSRITAAFHIGRMVGLRVR